MTELVRFQDNQKGRWANIRMDNGDPCWISVAQTGVLIKKSKVGLFGAKVYEESDALTIGNIISALNDSYRDNLAPQDIGNPVLRSYVNAVLHCSDLAEVRQVLDTAHTSE